MANMPVVSYVGGLYIDAHEAVAMGRLPSLRVIPR